MQHTQGNYRSAALGALLVVVLVFTAKSAFSAGIANRGRPDPILTGQADGPCDPRLAQPNLTPGTDVEGHQVAPADIQNSPIPFQGQLPVPLKQGQGPAYVAVDGKTPDSLLNPKSACH